GRRLEARDVLGCPSLPNTDRLLHVLRTDHAVVVNGQTGTGKSITAYQALHTLVDEGYEVLRLRDNSRSATLSTWLADLVTFPHRRILFIDDAQDLDADTVRELTETATVDQLVLIVGIDHVTGGVTT